MLKRRKPRRRLSMTPLIDIIFLLLLFFMLSSTFSRFAQVELTSAGAGKVVDDAAKPLFIQLSPATLSLNGRDMALADLQPALQEQDKPRLLISLKGDVDAQRLTDLLVVLRGVSGASVTVLEGAG